TSSMSSVRTHFWIDVAVENSGVSWPRKYGLNGTIPALTNSRLGSSRTSDALAISACPTRTKWSRKRRRISWVCTGGLTAVVNGCEVLARSAHQPTGAGVASRNDRRLPHGQGSGDTSGAAPTVSGPRLRTGRAVPWLSGASEAG